MHFWYTPDSYDKNLPADVAPERLEPDKRIRGERSSGAAARLLACSSDITASNQGRR